MFYVAQDGNDNWSGTRPQPNKEKTDGPFATLARARDAIRELRRQQAGQLHQPVTVFIRGGMHFLKEPLVLTPEDSGTEHCPVTFAAYGAEKPVISGGRLIAGWRQVTVEGKQLWMAEIPAVREQKWYFRQLWVNGTRRVRARHPNTGYLQVAEVLDDAPESKWNEGQTRFRFKPGDLQAWPTAGEAEVVVMNRWVESRLPIANVDETEHIVSFGKSSVFRLEPGDPYYVEHLFEALDAPGEWYLNRKTGALYYWPFPEENMPEAEVIAPVLTQVIRLEGKPQTGQFVEHLRFRGLTFSHTEWYFPQDSPSGSPKPQRGGFSQAAVGVPGAIYGEGAHHCLFEDCVFTRLGNYAVELGRGCRNNRIIGCEFADLGAGGIKLGEPVVREKEADHACGNEIADCRIHDGGRLFHSAIGIWVGQSYNNRIAHNLIHDFYYTGISIGWTWGYGPALAKGNIVEFNHVHHIGVLSNGDGPILSDMGGIYTLGKQPGTVIRNNLWHDIAGLRYGGWGIYFDEGSSEIVAENNLVYRTTHGGFHQHYGRENVVRNNIFAFARDHQIQRTRPEPHLSFTFEHNIVYWNRGVALGGEWSDDGYRLERNLYYQTDGQLPTFGKWTWEQWRQRGQDAHSLVADPLFVDPERGDFSLKDNGPAAKIGFRPFDLSNVGPRRKPH